MLKYHREFPRLWGSSEVRRTQFLLCFLCVTRLRYGSRTSTMSTNDNMWNHAVFWLMALTLIDIYSSMWWSAVNHRNAATCLWRIHSRTMSMYSGTCLKLTSIFWETILFCSCKLWKILKGWFSYQIVLCTTACKWHKHIKIKKYALT